MAITVKHKFVSAVPDAGDPTIVQPSNWNDTHDLTGTVPVTNGGTGAATASDGLNNLLPSQTGNNGKVLATDGTNASWTTNGSGDVVGPSSATDNAIARFDGTTGKLIQNSGVTVDDNSNITANALDDAYTNTAASGTQIVLTVASPRRYTITGSGGQVIKLPDATTLTNGTVFQFDNNQSSGAITVNNNSNTLIVSVPSGGFVLVNLLSNAIAAGSWDRHDQAPSNVSWSTNTFDYAGSFTSGTWNGNAVAYNRGGTGQSSAFTAGGIVYGSTTSALAVTSIGTTGQVLTSAGAGTPTWTTPTTGTVTSVAATAGTGISVSGSPITSSGTLTITNTAPDQTVAIASGTGISVTGTYPNFTVTNTSPSSGGTVTSVTGTAPVVSSGGNTPAISMAAANTTTNGYLTSTDWNTFNGKGSGSVTSVALTAPSIFTVTGSPITSSGTLALTYSGTALPILNGGTGQTTANAAFNALAPSQTANSGKYLTTDGTNTSWVSQGNAYTRTSFTATAAQTTFTVTYTVGLVEVYVNGVFLNGTDFTATNGTSIVLAVACNAGDIVETVAFSSFSVANTVTSFSGGTTGLTPNTATVGAVTLTGVLGAANGGFLAWQSVQTANFTAVNGQAYPVNTTSGAITVTLPSSPSAGNFVTIVDYAGTALTNNITISGNGSKIQGLSANVIISANRQAYNFVYIDSTQGWISYAQQYSAAPYLASYLIIGGGGAGGSSQGGGGGAGGLLSGTTTLLVGTNYSVVVGAGGSGNATANTLGGSGTNSSAFSLSAIGGGGGGGGNRAGINAIGGASGGSGGGGAGSFVSAQSGGSGTSGQGNNGGTGFQSTTVAELGGGGGGSSAVGGSYNASGTAGNGGAGTSNSITGSAVTYAGGGGGGIRSDATSAGTGGSGGGGNGASGANVGSNATANTGSGGGAAGGLFGNTTIYAGGNGGSGIVIISVPTVAYSGVTTGSPTITTSGSNTIIKFTTSGSYTA